MFETGIVDPRTLDNGLVVEARAFFDDALVEFDKTASAWEGPIRDEFIRHEWNPDATLLTSATSARAYNSRFSVLLGLVEHGAPMELVDRNILGERSDDGVWPLADPSVNKYLVSQLRLAENIGTPTVDPVHALATSIWLGDVHAGNKRMPDRPTTTNTEPTRLAKEWAAEQGILGSAVMTSMLVSARNPAVYNKPPVDSDKVILYMLATSPDRKGHQVRPMAPEVFHALAKNSLRRTVYYGDTSRKLAPNLHPNAISATSTVAN